MGGMKSLFTKIIPIIMLVCFICLGITHVFGRFDAETGQSNITYMSQKTIQTGTEENPYELTYYELDVDSYMHGMENNILEDATTNVIDTEAYTNLFENYNEIWENGYQIGDASRTLINTILLTLNTFILTINIVIVPLRIIAGLILTGLTLFGINIESNGIIITSLKTLLNLTAIPFINPTYDTSVLGTNYLMKNTLVSYTYDDYPTYHYYNIDVNFTSVGGGRYKNIKTGTYYNEDDLLTYIRVWYTDTDNYEILVYENARGDTDDGWIYADSRNITISQNNNFEDAQNYRQLLGYLEYNAIRQ